MTLFQVAVKTHNDAHLALSPSPHDSADMLEVVLGGRQNTRSWISLGKMGEALVSVPTPGILSWDEFRSFWVSWKGGVVQVRRSRVRVWGALYRVAHRTRATDQISDQMFRLFHESTAKPL